jgi:predicted permease
LSAALLPALQASRYDIQSVLGTGSRASPGDSRVRNALSILQAALCVALLTGAGALVHSLNRVRAVDLGLDTRDVVVVSPTFEQGVSSTDAGLFRLAAAERLRSLPGVNSASVALNLPFFSVFGAGIRVPGLDSVPTLGGGGPYINAIDPDFFATLGVRIVRGRAFRPEDDSRAVPVIIVSEVMARTLWPGEDALGKCVVVDHSIMGSDPPCREIVGVTEDARRFTIVQEVDAMQFYVPLEQTVVPADNARALAIRLAPGLAGSVIPLIQGELMALDARLRIASVEPLQQRLEYEERSWRMGATLFTTFGFLALIVAAIGLYGVLAFNVAQRSMELGIRSALGASRRALIGLVVSHSLRIVGGGIVLGLLAALLAGSRLEPLLFETSPREPVVFASVILLVLAVGVLASLLPASRAASVEPQVTLRAG